MIAMLTMLMLDAAAAAPAPQELPDAPLKTQVATSSGYTVGVDDVLAVNVFGEEDLSSTYRVTDDGAIDFPMLGRVSVSGMTTAQIDSLLTAQLGADYLVEPHVEVGVSEFASQAVQVLGAVKKPGQYTLQGETTVTQLLAMAGGVTEEAATRVQLSSDGSTVVEEFTLDQVLAGTGVRFVEPSEVLFVPQGQFVYVSGEVKKPGSVPFHEGLTVMQALTKSGGPERTAKLKEAYILRGDQTILVNVKAIMRGKSADMKLLPDDQLYLKESVF